MIRILGSNFLRLRAGGMSSPASCEGGGVKSRKPGGSEMSSRIEDRGELGVSPREVRLEMSEATSKAIVVVVVTTTGVAVATSLFAASSFPCLGA